MTLHSYPRDVESKVRVEDRERPREDKMTGKRRWRGYEDVIQPCGASTLVIPAGPYRRKGPSPQLVGLSCLWHALMAINSLSIQTTEGALKPRKLTNRRDAAHKHLFWI
eukprot:scaffold620_cov282-Pinguiococcus_pyrenoidosus.AAC.7